MRKSVTSVNVEQIKCCTSGTQFFLFQAIKFFCQIWTETSIVEYSILVFSPCFVWTNQIWWPEHCIRLVFCSFSTLVPCSIINEDHLMYTTYVMSGSWKKASRSPERWSLTIALDKCHNITSQKWEWHLWVGICEHHLHTKPVGNVSLSFAFASFNQHHCEGPLR